MVLYCQLMELQRNECASVQPVSITTNAVWNVSPEKSVVKRKAGKTWVVVPMTRRWVTCCVHCCSFGTSLQGHLPGDVARRVCFTAWSANLVAVIFHPDWGWATRVLCPADKETRWSSSPLLISVQGSHMTGGWKGQVGLPFPAGFPGDCHTQRAGWPLRDGSAHCQPCSLKAELCLFLLYDLSFREGFGLPSVAWEHGWWRTGAESSTLHSVALTWAASTAGAWGMDKASQPGPPCCQGRKIN